MSTSKHRQARRHPDKRAPRLKGRGKGKAFEVKRFAVCCARCGKVTHIAWGPGQKPRHRRQMLRKDGWLKLWLTGWVCPGCQKL